MKTKNLLMLLTVGSVMFFSCKKEGCTDANATNYDSKAKKDDGSCILANNATQTFKVSVENVLKEYQYSGSGVFNTPVGASAPGGAGPGKMYKFKINAGPGSKLSFATMYVESNDLFFAPNGNGIDLFNGNTPNTGDVTSQIILWDAGTEVNQMPGSGADQPMRQSGPNTGATETGGTVKNITAVNDGFSYPSVASTIKVSLAQGASVNEFEVTIENLSGSSTPIAPGVWVVHSGADPLFKEGSADYGYGLEAVAEDGMPTKLAADVSAKTGINTPFAPVAWAVHASGTPVFSSGSAASSGLESIAEDGDPTALVGELGSNSAVVSSGAANTAVGSSSPGPIASGGKYEFTVTAKSGDRLSLATMFVQSNDWFYGFKSQGIELWVNGSARTGDVTSEISLWDAGTEVNEYPGAGLNQAPRQSAANTGSAEGGSVLMVSDGKGYTNASKYIKVTITPM